MRILIPAGRGLVGLAGEHLEGEVEVPEWFGRLLVAQERATVVDAPAEVRHLDPTPVDRDPKPKGRRR